MSHNLLSGIPPCSSKKITCTQICIYFNFISFKAAVSQTAGFQVLNWVCTTDVVGVVTGIVAVTEKHWYCYITNEPTGFLLF